MLQRTTIFVNVFLLINDYLAYPSPSPRLNDTHGQDDMHTLDRRSSIRHSLTLAPRATLEVIWSCLATTISCTWVAIHPNISFFDHQNRGRGLWLRRPVEDRRGAAVLQPLWFVLQIVVRAGVGLDVTTVGLTTGALVAAALAMYWCWWSRPLNVQCPVVLYLSSPTDEVETEDGGTGVPSESSGHIELPDAEDGLSANQILAPQSTIQRETSRPTLPMPEIDKERLESQELQDDSKGNGAHNRTLAQLASKARATLSRMTILTHKAQSISKSFPRSLVWLRAHLAPLAVCIAGYIVVWPVEAITGSATIEHNRYASGARATSSSILDAAHSGVLTAFYVSDPDPNPSPGTGVGGGGGGGQSVIAVFVLGFAFGAIHCAAWAYPFPSLVERTIWRVAICAITAPFGFFVALTLVTVILAVVIALTTSIVRLILPRAVMDRMRSAVRYGVEHGLKPVLKVFTSIFRLLGVDPTLAIGIAFYVYLSVYAVARTAILVLFLASLRKLPSSALQTVDWVRTLIPHI